MTYTTKNEYTINLTNTEFGILDSSLDMYAKKYEKKLKKHNKKHLGDLCDLSNCKAMKYQDKINTIKSLKKKLAKCLFDD